MSNFQKTKTTASTNCQAAEADQPTIDYRLDYWEHSSILRGDFTWMTRSELTMDEQTFDESGFAELELNELRELTTCLHRWATTCIESEYKMSKDGGSIGKWGDRLDALDNTFDFLEMCVVARLRKESVYFILRATFDDFDSDMLFYIIKFVRDGLLLMADDYEEDSEKLSMGEHVRYCRVLTELLELIRADKQDQEAASVLSKNTLTPRANAN